MIKKITYLLVLISLFSCQTKNDSFFDTPQKVIVAGKIHNSFPSLQQVEITVNRLGRPQDEIIAKLDTSGCFNASFETYLPTDFIIRYTASCFAIAHPNDSVFFEVDGSTRTISDYANSIKFKGDSKETNQAIVKMDLLYKECQANSYEKRMAAFKDLNTNEYLVHIDSVYKINQRLYKEFVHEANPNGEAKRWAKMYIEQAYFDALNDFPGNHSSMNNLRDFEVEASFYEPLTRRLPLTDSMLTNAYSTNSYISNMYNYSYQNIRLSNTNHPSNVNLDSLYTYDILKYIIDPELRQLVLFKKFHSKLYSKKIAYYEKYNDLLEQYIQDAFLRVPLDSLYQKVKREIETPKFTSDKILNKINSSSAHALMDSILSQNKGKVIYIDCWAVWCKPCIANFPASNKLHKEFENQDIEFVYLCLESDSSNWQKLIKEHDLKGQNYLVDNEQSRAIRDAFEIVGIPHYILIDKNGMITDKNADRPITARDKIKKMINEK